VELRTLGFTLATGVLGALNLLNQRFTVGGPVIHFEVRSIPVLLGVVLVVVWLFLTWDVLRFLVAAALAITGVQLLRARCWAFHAAGSTSTAPPSAAYPSYTRDRP
jgi:hypothetical protein